MKRMKKMLTALREDLALILGGILIAAGAAMIYIPAGVITAGVLLIAGAAISSGGDGA